MYQPPPQPLLLPTRSFALLQTRPRSAHPPSPAHVGAGGSTADRVVRCGEPVSARALWGRSPYTHLGT
jgi:hypothetical protein